jgi:hypothetical protein
MDERQKLQHDLYRYQTFRQLVTDQRAIAAIEEQIREIRDRLAQIEIEMGREEGDKPVPRNPPDRSD